MNDNKQNKKNGMKNSKQSLLPIYILMILKKNSSSEKPLTRSEITDFLKKYKIEIGSEDRKTVPRCINTLAIHFQDSIVEIKGKKGTPTAWYLDISNVPMFESNIFSNEEMNMFIDMISELKIISNECTSSLISKLISTMNEEEQKNIRRRSSSKGAHKCENNPLLEIKNKIEKAIEYYREITFKYKINGEEQIFTVIPHTIKAVNGEVFLNAFCKSGEANKFYLDHISSISIGKEVEEIYGDDEFDLETESSKIAKNIGLDTLFSNLKKINYAIKNRQTLRLDYLGYRVKENRIKLESKVEDKIVFPLNTAFKDGKYYLIALDTQSNYAPVFYRLDLISNLEYDAVLDFMERRKFDVKETHEYTDTHPYMLPGFTKMGVRFLIDSEALERVFDAFGNKAIPCGEVWGYQTAGENARKLAEKFPELNFSNYLGLDHNARYTEIKIIETTDEEAFRFAMANADVVELLAPAHLRERILDVSKKIEKRYSKVKR